MLPSKSSFVTVAKNYVTLGIRIKIFSSGGGSLSIGETSF